MQPKLSRLSRFYILKNFIRFYFAAKTKYRTHSPYVFEFVKAVLEDNRNFYVFGSIRSLRSLLRQDHRKIDFDDPGAGSLVSKKRSRTIRAIAASAGSSPFKGGLLFRSVNHFKPQTILELGTSLGISTLYLHFGAQNARFITLEGVDEIASVAKQNFTRLKVRDIELVSGNFDDTLPNVLNRMQKLDFLFLDGNHRKLPTLDYFEQCLKFAHNDSVFVIDDIYWSEEMTEAWQEIKNHPEVTLSIDLFFLGFVFFRKENIEKEHFKLIKASWKPWEMGFFN